jgi:N-acetylmuramoyl-L-alanine amidase
MPEAALKIRTDFHSPNFNDRPLGAKIDFLIIHYTACDFDFSLEILCDPLRENPVSAHYLIDEGGHVFRLVDEMKRAWHCGQSFWKGKEALNDFSIGIELVNPGRGADYRPFTKPQMNSLSVLTKEIIQRHAIPPQHVLGHSDVAPLRKEDPGELFDWKWMAAQGVGVYINDDDSMHSTAEPSVVLLQSLLSRYGYKIPLHGQLDSATQKVIQAFQMHFCPQAFVKNDLRTTIRVLEKLVQKMA